MLMLMMLMLMLMMMTLMITMMTWHSEVKSFQKQPRDPQCETLAKNSLKKSGDKWERVARFEEALYNGQIPDFEKSLKSAVEGATLTGAAPEPTPPVQK
eukprot:1793917-Karenia_brevis.AAC.1